MATDSIAALNEILQKDEATLVQSWVDNQINGDRPSDPIGRAGRSCWTNRAGFMALMRDAVASG